ncbi:hypothetical protein EYF80_021644 [Liparis tanakae]|uniref:Uncharacterized protein n=1 Tax=Liparis tanakae TaxID=230148 RepID=A0A4Z2HRG0_9TELE|nr:hypothetical protein EYF80_021644 [Liparis tanakae]
MWSFSQSVRAERAQFWGSFMAHCRARVRAELARFSCWWQSRCRRTMVLLDITVLATTLVASVGVKRVTSHRTISLLRQFKVDSVILITCEEPQTQLQGDFEQRNVGQAVHESGDLEGVLGQFEDVSEHSGGQFTLLGLNVAEREPAGEAVGHHGHDVVRPRQVAGGGRGLQDRQPEHRKYNRPSGITLCCPKPIRAVSTASDTNDSPSSRKRSTGKTGCCVLRPEPGEPEGGGMRGAGVLTMPMASRSASLG